MADAPYMKLDVWQKSMDLVSSIYTATQKFPKDELYTLTSQLRRAAISIPSNIAEGRSKRTTKEFMRFVNMASGSTSELETQIMIGQRLGYLSEPQTSALLEEASVVGRMLNKLYIGLENKLSSPSDPLASNL